VWDAHTLSLVDRLTGHTEAVLALAAADGTLASGSFDTTLRLWSIEDGFKCIQELRGHEDAIRTLASSGEAIFSGSYDGSLGFWGAHAGVGASAERDSG
jgi:WD40 repeat protein